MTGFIDDQRNVHGVEPICRGLPIAPPQYYARLCWRADPAKASLRQPRDPTLRPRIQKVRDDSRQVCGVRKAWRQLCRDGVDVARCTGARLMAGMGLRGAVRGKVVKTTISDTSAPCPRDKVNRQLRAPAPDMLRVSDFTCVSAWQGFACVAVVTDTFANRVRHWSRTNGDQCLTWLERVALRQDRLRSGCP